MSISGLYTYQALNQGGQFRTVVIESTPSRGLISCELKTISLNDNIDYHALSYLWGPEQPLSPILLGGNTVHVRQNLFHFLQLAQTRFSGMLIFIDAICINQADIAERNQQVQMMGEIYTNSKMTISWLGQGDESIETALPFIASVSELSVNNLQDYYIGFDRRERQQAWSGLYRLCSSRYWTRVWIVQEILKPRSILLCYGQHELEWQTISTLFRKLGLATPSPAPLPDELVQSKLYQFVDIRDNMSGPNTIHCMLMKYSDSAASELRDRIFALLSLGQGGHDITVDYGISLPQLFIKSLELWGAQDGQNALKLAKQLSDNLLSRPHDIEGHENDPKAFIFKLIQTSTCADHEGCDRQKACIQSRSIRYHLPSGCSTNDMSKLPSLQNGREWDPADFRSDNSSHMHTITVGRIKNSDIRCGDLILQVVDTTIFLVAREMNSETSIVGRLSIVWTEEDGKSVMQAKWFPVSKRKSLGTVQHIGDGRAHVEFNAFTLRSFLVNVEFVNQDFKIHQDGIAHSVVSLEYLGWHDEIDTYPLEALHRVQTLYELQSRQEGPSDERHRPSLSFEQAHQAWRDALIDVKVPANFKPTPAWQDLLKNTSLP